MDTMKMGAIAWDIKGFIPLIKVRCNTSNTGG